MDDRVAPIDPPTTPAATDTPTPSLAPVTPTAPSVVRPVRKQSRAGSVALGVAAFVAVAGLAFAGGRLTAPASAATPGGGNGFQRGGGFPFASFAAGGGPPGGAGAFRTQLRSLSLRGQVTTIGSDSITLTLDDGTRVTVPLDSQTTYHDSTSGSASDVTVGSTVSVEPGATSFQPGASLNPAASPAAGNGAGAFDFGPAVDVTVVH